MVEAEAFDLVRMLILALYGTGCALMVITNVVAYMVLRVPQRLGFLWWHVAAISLSFLCLSSVALERVLGRFGETPSWRTWVTLVGVATFAVAQLIIYNVERQRLQQLRAQLSGDVG